MLSNNWMKNWARRTAGLTALTALCIVAPLPLAATGSNVPPAVVTSLGTVPATGLGIYQANLALDACGNIYTMQSGQIYSYPPANTAVTGGEVSEIPAGGGAATVLVPAGGVSYDYDALWMDATKSNLYITEGPNTPQVERIPIVNCVPQPASAVPIPIVNLGAVSYYYSAGAVATDAAGDVFISTYADCCGQGNELVEEYAGYGSGATLLVSLTSYISSMTVDASNNIYYVAGGALFELPYVSGAYAAAPVPYGSGYSANLGGVTLDSTGNLYIADGGTTQPLVSANIFEIPYENGIGLNPSDQFVVAAGPTITSPVALDASGNLYFTDVNYSGSVIYANSLTYIYELTRDNANLGSQAVGSSGTATLNVVFNAPVTPATIGFVTNKGVFASATGGTCAANTAYVAGNSCTVNASFAPVAPGLATGALVLADSTGAAMATANLSGTGLGAGLTIDPGTVTAIGSGLKAPMSVALDVAGDLFIADSASSNVWEVAAGSATPVSIGSGLSSPEGVAVDGAGNVYIADTDNSRIVEIPVVNGALSTSAQSTVVSGSTSIAGSKLSNPAGLSVDALGNLYIADTGNNRIVYLPYSGGWDSANAFTLGSGWTSPLATTVTASGLIYVADSGGGAVYSISYASSALGKAVVETGLSNPSALATDAAGDLFVVDQGNSNVVRIPNVAGSLATGSSGNVSFGIANPYGLAIDSAGNLYVSDNVNAAAYLVARTNSTLSFGTSNPGSTSNPASVHVESAGNQTLTFATPYDTASGDTTDFALVSSEANACADGASLAVGLDCLVEATFTPPATGTFTSALALSSNATNAASPEVTFTGTGGPVQITTTTLTVTSPSGTVYYGEAIALSVSVTSASGTPTGSVVLMVDGSQVATSTLTNGTVTFSLKNGLPGGSHTLQADYQGAITPTIPFGSSDSAIDTVVVSPDPTTTVLSFTTAFIGPASQAAGAALTLTATVSSTFAGIPSGTVTFTITDSGGNTVTGTGTVASSSAGDQATYLYTPVAPASGVTYDVISISAAYSGDPDFMASSSGSQSFDVAPASGSVGVAPSGTNLLSSKINNTLLTFTSTSYGGWQGIVSYQCVASSLPVHAICVFSPGQVSVMANTSALSYPPATTTLTVLANNPPNSPAGGSMLWWAGGLTGLLLLWTRRRMMRGAWGTLTMLIGGILLAVAANGLVACNSGSSFSTPPGSSTVTVVASSDPYLKISTGTTQPCVNPTTGVTGPTQGPCSQQTFHVSLTVQ